MIRRARPEDHRRITEIRNCVTENILRDPSRVTNEDYRWFEQNTGVWVWEENGTILGFSAADTRDGSIWALFMANDHQRRHRSRPVREGLRRAAPGRPSHRLADHRSRQPGRRVLSCRRLEGDRHQPARRDDLPRRALIAALKGNTR
jgi:hypothetical protein